MAAACRRRTGGTDFRDKYRRRNSLGCGKFPELPVSIYDLGLIYGVAIEPEGEVAIEMTLTAPNCPAAQTLPAEVVRRVREIPGVKDATVQIVFDPPWALR